jgi:RNA polymerase sigma factor (sigma-70 family)
LKINKGHIDLTTVIRQCIEENREAQEQLYKYFYARLMPVCMSYTINSADAIDIYNRAFLKVFNKLGQYKNKGSFEGWVRRIVVNTALDFVRSVARRNNTVPVENELSLASGEQILSGINSQEMLEIIKGLPALQKAVLSLFVLEGFTHKEIAQKLNIKEGTSKWYLSEARKELKRVFIEEGLMTNL